MTVLSQIDTENRLNGWNQIGIYILNRESEKNRYWKGGTRRITQTKGFLDYERNLEIFKKPQELAILQQIIF